MIRRLDQLGAALTLALPLLLLHARAAADVALTTLGLLFLLRAALTRDWRWLRDSWIPVALAWWLWLVLCSLPWRAGPEAAAVLRFPLCAAALEHWLLREPWMRRWIARLLRWSMAYMVAQCALQFATGRNLFGLPRGADGELTGPYKNPSAGPIMSRLLYPSILPLATNAWRSLLWLAGGILVMVMVGQRMPLLLSLLGLLICALFRRNLRAPVLATLALTALLLLALPALSPQAAHRVETKFSQQMANLPDSAYGLIAARATAILREHPVFGAGFDGFRRLCDDPRYFHGWPGSAFAADGGAAGICVQHPHSYYLQAALEGGLPGLALFSAMAIAWLRAAARRLRADPDPLRVGLFAALAIHLWPIAASTDWVAMPLSGWFTLELGLALALARPYMSPTPRTSEA